MERKNLFFVTLEKEDVKDECDVISHYCVITSLSRLLSSKVRKDSNGMAYVCRKCCNSFKS